MYDDENCVYTFELSEHNVSYWTHGYERMLIYGFIKKELEHLNIYLKFNPSHFVVLNQIRTSFGMSQIRAELEMCYGPDPQKPIHADISINDENEIIVHLYNIIDLRQYRELRD